MSETGPNFEESLFSLESSKASYEMTLVLDVKVDFPAKIPVVGLSRF